MKHKLEIDFSYKIININQSFILIKVCKLIDYYIKNSEIKKSQTVIDYLTKAKINSSIFQAKLIIYQLIDFQKLIEYYK